MSRSIVCLLVSLVVTGPGLPSAGATPGSPASPGRLGSPLANVPIGIAAGDAASPRSKDALPHELALASTAPAGVPAIVDAELQVLRRAWAGRMADLRSAAGEDAAAEPGEPGAPDARVRAPITSSDVDGDGQDDVLFFDIGIDEYGFRIEAGITALDGDTGQHLWSRMYGNPYNIIVLSPRDVTGDGADDLLVLVVEFDADDDDLDVCAGVLACVYDSPYTYRWDLALVSGATGSDLWSRGYDGSLRYQGAYVRTGPDLVEYAHITGVNAVLDVRRSDDLDGDGLSDFTLAVHGYEREFLYSRFVQDVDHYLYTTAAEALAGDEGATLLTRTVEDQPGAPSLIPAGDATLDGRGDLFWILPTESSSPTICPQVEPCSETQTLELHVELVDPAATDPRWEAGVAVDGAIAGSPVLTGSDLTGDGRADLLLGLTLSDGSQRAIALSGTDGSTAWTLDTILTDPPTALGSIDGGAGSDLLFWEGEDVLDEEAPIWFRVRLRRVDGATGRELFATQHELLDTPKSNDTIFATPAGDVDADGVPDIAHAVWTSDGYWEQEGSASSVLRVESGATGVELLRLERDRNALLFPAGDLTPGGPRDLLEGSVPYRENDFRLSAIEMPSGRTMWSHLDVLFTAFFGTVHDDAGQGDDVVYARTQAMEEAPKRRSRIDLLDGSTGTPTWGLGPPLAPPPPGPEWP